MDHLLIAISARREGISLFLLSEIEAEVFQKALIMQRALQFLKSEMRNSGKRLCTRVRKFRTRWAQEEDCKNFIRETQNAIYL